MARRLPLAAGMKLGTRMLRSIARDIDGNRPLWATLRINEYLAPHDPLRRAVAARAGRSVDGERYEKLGEIACRILEGCRLGDLTPEERASVEGFEEPASPAPRPRVTLNRPSWTMLMARRSAASRRREAGRTATRSPWRHPCEGRAASRR